ncbi:MAG: glycosyltransferase 87 family protein [bacterium]
MRSAAGPRPAQLGTRSSAVRARVVLASSLVAQATVLTIGLHRQFPARILWTEVTATVLFGLALLALHRSGLDQRRALLLVLGVGALFQLVALTSAPTSSDDAYRYGWDAKVQLAGIDPYRYAPDASALDRLRTPTLFPARSGCAWSLPDGRCSLINRPGVHTIYPPVAEAAFTAIRVVSFGVTDGTVPLRIVGALGAVAVAGVLARRAAQLDRPAWTVALWAWCPVTAVEIGNNAHIDWLAVLLAVLALGALREHRPAWAGALLGAAVATKIYPGLLVFSMLRRRPVVVTAAAAAVVVASYVPHVAAVGTDVIGFLPGYLREEDYVSGTRFMLLDLVLPAGWVTVAGALVLAAAAAWTVRHADADAPEEAAVVLVGVALLVTTPGYAWYALLLLALVSMTARLEWLPLVLAMTVAMLAGPEVGRHGGALRTACFTAAALAVPVVHVLLRRRRAGSVIA